MAMLQELDEHVKEAVAFYWRTRKVQARQQVQRKAQDQGLRAAVTGGKQMDGFIQLITNLVLEAGIEADCIYYNKSLELPGYFRPTKEWDLLVIKDRQLLAAIEVKSQVGPSFGNNFNNRTEEAMGSALDLWTAFREGALSPTIRPWLGYVFLLEDCPKSRSVIKVKEPHFKVFSEFKGASYAKRYEIFCRRLILERHYTATAFLTSEVLTGLKGNYSEPAKDISFGVFARSLAAHIASFSKD